MKPIRRVVLLAIAMVVTLIPAAPGNAASTSLPLSEGFDDCTLAGWEIISVDADMANTWTCSSTFSNIDVNGFGDDAPADEWLITPPLDLDAQPRDTLNFRNYTNFSDAAGYPTLEVLFSTDYDGFGDPAAGTWTALSGINFSPEDSGSWVDSGDVDLSFISGGNVYVAFHYTSSGTGGGGAATWRIDAVNLFSAPETLGQPLPLSEGFDDCTLAGWEIISVDADMANTWTCSSTFSNIDVNGFGDDAPADEWLITPPLDLDAQPRDTLNFRNYTNFSDAAGYPTLEVLFSTDYDGFGDPAAGTWTALSGINFSPEDSGSWVDSGDVDLSFISGGNVYVAFHYTSSGTGGGGAATWRIDAVNLFSAPSVWVINEIHADPASDLSGDANGDGVRSATDDEFVEIVNNGTEDLDISGWTINDAVGVRHTFPVGTIVTSSCPVVVFGGGSPTGDFGFGLVQTASSGALGFNNGGDSVTLTNGAAPVVSYTYGSEGGDNQSLTRDPDISGDPLVRHSTAAGSDGALYSPANQIDGIPFSGCVGPQELKIHDVQGSDEVSPFVGRAVIVEGVVVGDFQNNAEVDDGDLSGFFLQEEDADADGSANTSEGVFINDGASPAIDVMAGDLVQVTGLVVEDNSLTEITPLTVTVISSDSVLPTPAVVSLPVSSVSDFEAYEGMAVNIPQEMSIAEYFNFDRYNEVVIASERLFQPTAVFAPGTPAAAELAIANSLSQITLDDGRDANNPDPALHPNGAVFDLSNLFRGGDTLENVTGVMDFDRGLYRIQPTADPIYTAVNGRTDAPADVGGDISVAAFNVLNYFTTLGSRGASNADEFTRQRDKIFTALAAIDADIVGLIEIENNGTALDDLVAGLNAYLGSDTYAAIDTGVIGSDQITVAFIYKPASVTPLGGEAVLDDPSFVDPNNIGSDKNRPALAQTFQAVETAGVFTAVVNHLKSKGSGCGAGDDDPEAGSCNLTRTLAAQALATWLDTDPTGSGDDDFLIMGDLNSYDKEDPITALRSAGYADLVGLFGGELAYSYLFSAQLGYLDYAMANASLASQVTETTVWHINADEPDLIDYDTSFKQDAQDAIYVPDQYRSSDHDPVIVGLDLNGPPSCEAAVPSIDSIWPVSHKMVDIEVVGCTDADGDAITITIDSIFQDEPVDAAGDGNTEPDGDGIGTSIAQVRAERSGKGDGRVYTIGFTATDAFGNTATGEVTVEVRLSRKTPAVDGGAIYDSTIVP